jgi:ABC-type nitrate/sulfonate/bicarbonate transport system permease component
MAHAASASTRLRLPGTERTRDVALRVGLFLVVLATLWLLWEGFKAFGESTGLRVGQFEANDRTMPHIHDIFGQLFEPSRRNGPLLIGILWDAALFTAKEAAAGFVLGAVFGFTLGALLLTRVSCSGALSRTSSRRRRFRSSPSRRWSSCG